MRRTGRPGFRRYFRVGPIALDRVGVGSWDSMHYPLFGAWRHDRGFTLRFRGWLLLVQP
jgi:hypothetical protein